MNQLTFRGAYIRYADLKIKEEAGVFTRLHITSDLSQPVMDALGWSNIPDCAESIKLTGALLAVNLSLDPADKNLKQHGFECECTAVEDFQLFRVKDGESISTELRFIARIVASGAVTYTEQYLRTVGQHPGALTVGYTQQDELPLEQSGEQQFLSAAADQEPIENTLGGDELARHQARSGTLPSIRQMQNGLKEPLARRGIKAVVIPEGVQ